MTIDLAKHASSTTRQKSAEGLIISDHTFDLAKFKGELIFTGKGTRGLVIKNAKDIEIKFQDCVIDNAGTGVVIKFDGRTERVKVNGTNTTKLYGKAGNSQSQMIYFVGTWNDIEVCGFFIDQRRDNKTGTTVTGACCQTQGVLSSTHNLGMVHWHDMVLMNCGDEGFYNNHFQNDGGYCQGKELIVENCRVLGCGRDPFQHWGFDKVTYRGCYGENGNKEADKNHFSCFSLNGDTEELLIENCDFKNVAQLIYCGVPSKNATIKALIRNVTYEQGTHAGSRANQACYLKGPGVYRFENCYINAPAVIYGAFTADGCSVEVSKNCTVSAPKLFRDAFNGGSYEQITPDPVITKTVGEITIQTTKTWDGLETVQYFLPSGQELKP